MYCPSCSAEIPSSSKFCPECGAKVAAASAKFCPECGAKIDAASAKFCPECGAKVAAAAPAAAPANGPAVPAASDLGRQAAEAAVDGARKAVRGFFKGLSALKSAVEKSVAEAREAEARRTAGAAGPARKSAEAEAERKTEEAEARARREAKRKAAAERKTREEAEAKAWLTRDGEAPYRPTEPDTSYRSGQGNYNMVTGPIYVAEQAKRIIDKEGPLTEGLLFARVLDEWGLEDATDARRAVLRAALCREGATPGPLTMRLDEVVFWPKRATPEGFNAWRTPTSDPRSRRTFAQIPLEEIAAAIRAEAAESSGERPLADAVPGALARLGLPEKVTRRMKPALDAALRLAEDPDNDPETVSIPKEWIAAWEAEQKRQEEQMAEWEREEEEERKAAARAEAESGSGDGDAEDAPEDASGEEEEPEDGSGGEEEPADGVDEEDVSEDGSGGEDEPEVSGDAARGARNMANYFAAFVKQNRKAKAREEGLEEEDGE